MEYQAVVEGIVWQDADARSKGREGSPLWFRYSKRVTLPFVPAADMGIRIRGDADPESWINTHIVYVLYDATTRELTVHVEAKLANELLSGGPVAEWADFFAGLGCSVDRAALDRHLELARLQGQIEAESRDAAREGADVPRAQRREIVSCSGCGRDTSNSRGLCGQCGGAAEGKSRGRRLLGRAPDADVDDDGELAEG